jgi:hypothetical protein
VWLKTKQTTTDKLTRDEMPQVWADLLPRIERYQNAFQHQAWEMRPGYHCKYCPDKKCPNNEKR